MKSAFVALLAFSTLLSIRAADWPQWRGPARDGLSTETGLLRQWPAGGPPLAWKTNGLGPGYSTVAVAGDRVFTAGDDGESSFVHALDDRGRKVWTAKLGRPGERGGFRGPRATPTVEGDQLFMLGQFGDLVCYECGTGREIWRRHLKEDFSGEAGGWGYSESVLVDGDQVICTPGGEKGAVAALDRKTGRELWRTRDFRDSAEYVSPVLATIAGVKHYVQMTQRSVVGISRTGDVLWRASRRGSTAVIPTPVVHDDHVYVASGYGVGCHLFKVTRRGGTFRTEQVYANKVMVNHHGGVIRLGDHLYGYSDGKGWVCQDFKSGDMVWSDKKLGKGAAVYADGHFYLRSEGGQGTVALIEATPSAYREVGRFDQPNRSDKNSWPHPVVASGRLYLRDQDWLLCYDVKQ